MPANYEIELFKSGLSLLVAFLSLAATLLIGRQLTVYWNLREKKNELNLSMVHAFHAIYGEFKELVKIWRLVKKSPDVPVKVPPEERWILLKRACALESKSEALVLRATSERLLTEIQLDTLGLYRQAMQSIRESIRDDIACPFGSRGTEYMLLNQLAPSVASTLSAELPSMAPRPEVAKLQLAHVTSVTSRRWEKELQRIGPASSEAQNEDA
jgi:hypothetical protein